MDKKADKILEEALTLPEDKRASIADKLIASLDIRDPAIDAVWKEEAENRISMDRRGEMEIVSEAEAFRKYKKRKS